MGRLIGHYELKVEKKKNSLTLNQKINVEKGHVGLLKISPVPKKISQDPSKRKRKTDNAQHLPGSPCKKSLRTKQ